MRILLYVILGCLIVWLSVSCIVILWKILFRTDSFLEEKILDYFFIVGAILGFSFVFAFIYEHLLFFLPSSWGHVNENGDFETTRESISRTLGGISGIAFPFLLEKWTKKNRLAKTPETKAVVRILDEAKDKFDENSQAYTTIQEAIHNDIRTQGNEITKAIRESGKSPQVWVYLMICNISGDYAESGQHHIYRGVLNFTGERFRDIYYKALDELVKLGEIDEELAGEQKSGLRKNISSVG